LPNVGPYIYDVSISGFTRSSIYIYDISSLRVKIHYSSFHKRHMGWNIDSAVKGTSKGLKKICLTCGNEKLVYRS